MLEPFFLLQNTRKVVKKQPSIGKALLLVQEKGIALCIPFGVPNKVSKIKGLESFMYTIV